MKDYAAIQTNYSGAFPNVLAIDSTGAATPDGTEYIAAQINNGIFGWQQDLMDYASLTPDGVIEAQSTGQIKEAIQKGNSIGPGMYVQRAIYDNPATHGDRTIILAEQGVLIATYPELSAEVYVGDANNAAVAAAGGKYYKSSDAAGTTPNIAGPYLQLPAQPDPKFLKEYLGDGTDFTTSVTGITAVVQRSIAIPYETSNGAWRLLFNISIISTSGTVNGYSVSLSGVTFKNVSNFEQAVSISDFAVQSRSADQYSYCYASPGASNLAVVIASSIDTTISGGKWQFSGDVELDSKPTWADDFDIEWGITY